MSFKILKCTKCNNYSMQDVCPYCGAECVTVEPPKFSMEDKYGKYRRIAKHDERVNEGLI